MGAPALLTSKVMAGPLLSCLKSLHQPMKLKATV